jgi:rSAM/selenodomain-associated transferase 1/rSAM/selenodomain-associated transferase 2
LTTASDINRSLQRVPTLDSKKHLIVFGRYPAVGRVKTRLIPALGPAGAAALQKRLTERTMVSACRLSARTSVRVVFCHDGGSRERIDRWLGLKDIDYQQQASGDLGRRMYVAMCAAFSQGARQVVLIGTDIPGLSTAILAQAFDRLNDHDLVFGPSADGGYWLVGMTQPVNIFDGIAWSQSTVLDHTLDLARRKGVRPCQLDPLADLDTPGDLARNLGGELAKAPYLSVIIPTLNQAQHLALTLAAAASADSEVIVSDGGSTDPTVEIAASFVTQIVSGGGDRVSQLNRSAAVARGEVLLVLRADTQLPTNYVTHIFDTLMDRRTRLGAFRLATNMLSPAMRWMAYLTNLRAAYLQLPCADQGLFMRKSDFYAIGGFPNVSCAEDLYLVRQMARRGGITLVPATVVTSGRQWQRHGPGRAILINTAITVGCLADIPPHRLAPLVGWLSDKMHR